MVDGVDNNGDNRNGAMPAEPARTTGAGARGDTDPANAAGAAVVTGEDVELDETTRVKDCDKVCTVWVSVAIFCSNDMTRWVSSDDSVFS